MQLFGRDTLSSLCVSPPGNTLYERTLTKANSLTLFSGGGGVVGLTCEYLASYSSEQYCRCLLTPPPPRLPSSFHRPFLCLFFFYLTYYYYYISTIKVPIQILLSVVTVVECHDLKQSDWHYEGFACCCFVLIPDLVHRTNPRSFCSHFKALWFPLLETVMAPQRKCKDTTSAYFLGKHLVSIYPHFSSPRFVEKYFLNGFLASFSN